MRKPKKDPVGLELGQLAVASVSASVSAAGGTLQEASSRLKGYSRRNEKDEETPDMLRACLRDFPPEGQQNLIHDILARDDVGLKVLAEDIKRWVFYPSK